MKKYFCLVLHSHIPYTKRAGVWPFGEEWVLEGMLETYIPLLEMLEGIAASGKKIKITVGITPVLAEQLADEYFKSRFLTYARDKLKRAQDDINRFNRSRQEQLESLARFYKKLFEKRLNYFERISGDLIGGFSRMQKERRLEVITSAATHSYLPLLSRDSSISAQIKVGVESYKKHFGAEPDGIWLPECAYRPAYNVEGYYKKGIDEFLAENNLKYFFVDSHAIEGGETSRYIGTDINVVKPETMRTTFNSYVLKSGVYVLGRNKKVGMLVWSSEWGYPGDGNYREFHKKDSVSGMQYWKITSQKTDLGAKELYIPEIAAARVEENSEHFKEKIRELLSDFSKNKEKSLVVIAPYDTELYGHWWFEGIDWLRRTLKKILLSGINILSVNDYLNSCKSDLMIELPESSWGDGGGHYVWLNKDTRWMWEIIHKSEKLLEKTISDYEDKRIPNNEPLRKKTLDQILREKLLLESSDWPFLVSTWQAREYSEKRFLSHYNRFLTLSDIMYKKSITRADEQILESISANDSLFPDIDYRYFRKREP